MNFILEYLEHMVKLRSFCVASDSALLCEAQSGYVACMLMLEGSGESLQEKFDEQ